MIYKRMSGRLGNQMFQYAAIRSFHHKYRNDEKIILDFQSVYKLGTKEDGFKNQLGGFKLNDNVEFSDKMKMDFIPHLLFLIYKFLCMLLKIFDFNNSYLVKRKKLEDFLYPFYHKQGLYIYTDGYKEFDNCKKKNVYFFGFYESVDYFSDIVDILREEFSADVDLNNDELSKIISLNNTTCVSVRAGDFLSDQFKKDYYVCKPNYYLKSINYIKSKSDSIYIIFSDDIDWVKRNISFPKDIKCFYEEKKYNLYEKIYLMTHCNNYIMSNSSFSFWTQFLSHCDNKIVVAPSKWTNTTQVIDIYQDNWVKISVEEE